MKDKIKLRNPLIKISPGNQHDDSGESDIMNYIATPSCYLNKGLETGVISHGIINKEDLLDEIACFQALQEKTPSFQPPRSSETTTSQKDFVRNSGSKNLDQAERLVKGTCASATEIQLK